MHLLKKIADIKETPEGTSFFHPPPFKMDFNKQHVIQLMDKLESDNGDMVNTILKMEAELIEERERARGGEQLLVQQQIDQCEITNKAFREKLRTLKLRASMLNRPFEEKNAKLKAQAKAKKMGKQVDLAIEDMPEFKEIIGCMKRLNAVLKTTQKKTKQLEAAPQETKEA